MPALPTPCTAHVDYAAVYEPASDSFLLLDALAADAAFLAARFSAAAVPPVALEIGSGSGVVLAFLTANAVRLFGHRAILALATDANERACAATAKTVRLESLARGETAGTYLGSVVADLAAPLRQHAVDVLVFNPPYVPTPDLPALEPSGLGSWEEESRLLALTYAGGVDGMEVTERVLAGLQHLLDPSRGVAYILLCRQNRPEDVAERLRRGVYGVPWKAELIRSSGRTGGIEQLSIWRVWR